MTAILILVVFGPVAPARGLELLEAQDFKLELGGWSQAGYRVVKAPGDEDLRHEAYLGILRLFTKASYLNWGRAVLQVDGSSGDVVVLDGFAELWPLEGLTLRVGRFKVPTSAEFLISAAKTPFVNRASLVQQGFVPKRLVGGAVHYARRFELLEASLRAGFFSLSEASRELLPDREGGILSLRALLKLNCGLSLHLAYADLVLADNRWGDAPPADALGLRPIAMDRQLDVALIFENDGWTAYLEGVVAIDGQDDETPYAFYAMVLKDLKLADGDFSLEPGLRYDHSRRDQVTQQRFTAGLNFYLVDHFLCASLNYELMIERGQVGHLGSVQLQAGF